MIKYMDIKLIENNPKLKGFIGYIPKPLNLESKPEFSIFPFNVLIGRHTEIEGKQIIATALYEPDYLNFVIDDQRNMIIIYQSRSDPHYYLKMIINKDLTKRTCKKYHDQELIGIADGIIDWEKQEDSWNRFFYQVAFLGLEIGEKCDFL